MESRARIVRLLFLAIETLTLSMIYRVVAGFSTMEVKLADLYKTNAFDAPQMVWVRMSGVYTYFYWYSLCQLKGFPWGLVVLHPKK